MSESVFGVDIGCDRLHGFGKSGCFIHLFFHLFNGVHNGGMVTSLEFLADFAQGEVGQAANEVHGNLTGSGCFFIALLTTQGQLLQYYLVFADFGNDEGWRRHKLVFLFQHVTHSTGSAFLVDVVAQQLTVSQDLFSRCLRSDGRLR